MRITYDNEAEFAECVIRCNDTARKGKCCYCPFFDRCNVDCLETRHVLCADISPRCQVHAKGGE